LRSLLSFYEFKAAIPILHHLTIELEGSSSFSNVFIDSSRGSFSKHLFRYEVVLSHTKTFYDMY